MKKSNFLNIILFVLLSFSLQAQEDIHRTVVCQGNLGRLDSLLNTTDINIKNDKGTTLLLAAVFCRQDKVFDLLMERGADVNISNIYGNTPLLLAARYANIKMVGSLLDKDAIVNATDNQGRTPLFGAVQSGNKELLQLLLAKKAEINVVDSFGITPLENAILNKKMDFVKLLIDEKTDLSTKNNRGSTALEIAIREESDEIAEFLISKGADKNNVRTYKLKGKFIGQTKPGLEPKMFAPNFVSTEIGTHSAAFHPNGKEFYYTAEAQTYNGATIMTSKLINGTWSKPQPADIPGEYREVDPFITNDGSKLFYCSDRPINEGDSLTRNVDLWMQKRIGKKWGEPIHLGDKVNTKDSDWFPTISDKGTLFFSTGPGRDSKIYYSELKNGKYQKAIALSDSVNTKHYDYDPFIAPDESYLIFASSRPNGFGRSDLYISFKNEDDLWTKAKNMGNSINSTASEFAPSISPDGKYLFFTSVKAGTSDIYWVDSKVIDNLR